MTVLDNGKVTVDSRQFISVVVVLCPRSRSVFLFKSIVAVVVSWYGVDTYVYVRV